MSLLANQLEKAASLRQVAGTDQRARRFSVRRSLFIWVMLLAIFWTLLALGAWAIFDLIA